MDNALIFLGIISGGALLVVLAMRLVEALIPSRARCDGEQKPKPDKYCQCPVKPNGILLSDDLVHHADCGGIIRIARHIRKKPR